MIFFFTRCCCSGQKHSDLQERQSFTLYHSQNVFTAVSFIITSFSVFLWIFYSIQQHSIDPTAALSTSTYLHLYCLVRDADRKCFFEDWSKTTAQSQQRTRGTWNHCWWDLSRRNTWSVWKTCIRNPTHRSRKSVLIIIIIKKKPCIAFPCEGS